MSNKLAAELVMRLFHARTNSHVQHLATRSYAAHKALNEFYDGIVGLADDFAEAYQGVNGLLTEYPRTFALELNSQAMLTGLRKWIADNRNSVTSERNLQNIIDEIVTLIDSTLYKLKNLS